jgi:hypothetical protein
MVYAIKSDTLFFARHTNRVDLEAFTFLYPLADAALIRKMEGAEIKLERLDYLTRASQGYAWSITSTDQLGTQTQMSSWDRSTRVAQFSNG